MHLSALALYAGPDQVMTVTSGIAGVIGVLLMFWNKVVGAFVKIVHKVRGTTPEPASKDTPTPQG
jgi:hypothetical protein